MDLIFLAIPVALIAAGAALYAFVWATRTGQFDDLDTPAHRMLLDDAPVPGRKPPGSDPR